MYTLGGGGKIKYIHSYILYIFKLQGLLTPGCSGSAQGVPAGRAGSRDTNFECSHPNWVMKNSQEPSCQKADYCSHGTSIWGARNGKDVATQKSLKKATVLCICNQLPFWIVATCW